MSKKPDPYASEDFTAKYMELSKLPEPLRLAAALEETMQWPLHGKAADCLRKLHEENERLKAELKYTVQAITDPENQPSQFGTVSIKDWNSLTEDEIHEIYDRVARQEPYSMAVTRRSIGRAIEAKLKEKNT